MHTDNLWDQLAGGKSLIAMAGAGGKKTTMYAIAAQHPGHVGLTTTVNCAYPPPESESGIHLVLRPEVDLMEAARLASEGHRRVFFAQPGKRDGLASGVSAPLLARIRAAEIFDVVLVKADGARRRLLKAPADGEPVYPPGTELVLYLLSAHALGRKLSSGVVHRAEHFAAVTGAAEGAAIKSGHIVRLLTSESGALKGIEPGVPLIPVINRVDTPAMYREAREIAEKALAEAPRLSAVALGCMGEYPPRVEMIRRD